jgi:Skp family chaperone for outer membrane proteins
MAEQATQSFNINVQGDVSRQTRKEIVKMMPEISGGVNKTNKENNYKR